MMLTPTCNLGGQARARVGVARVGVVGWGSPQLIGGSVPPRPRLLVGVCQ